MEQHCLNDSNNNETVLHFVLLIQLPQGAKSMLYLSSVVSYNFLLNVTGAGCIPFDVSNENDKSTVHLQSHCVTHHMPNPFQLTFSEWKRWGMRKLLKRYTHTHTHNEQITKETT